MQKVCYWTSKLGETAMAVGALWTFMAGTFRRDNLPVVFQDLESAMTLAIAGAGTWIGSKVLLRRTAKPKRIDAEPAQAAYAMPGTPEWDDPVARRRTLDAMQKMGQEESGKTKERIGNAFGHSQERVALKPCWPQRKTSSWIGGLPSIPSYMDWPEVNWEPAPFLAQIALDDMPETLWQGAGPREGWLVFWSDPKDPCGVVVRHVTGEVEERAQPANAKPDWHWNMEPAGLKEALGDAANVPPRWYLEVIQGPALGAVEDMAEENPDHWDGEKGDYVWAKTWTASRAGIMGKVSALPELRGGVDWPSFFGLFALWRDQLNQRKAALEVQMENRADSFERLQAKHVAELKAISEDLETDEAAIDAKATEQAQFLKNWNKRMDHTAEELLRIKDLFPTLDQLEVELRETARATAFDNAIGQEFETLVQSFDRKTNAHYRPASEQFIENYARYHYTRDPDDVPQALFDLFAPLWELQCQETLIFLGLNHEGTESTQPDARLIDIPTHPLAGLSFGDDSRYYVDLPLESLVGAKWQDATANNTHGQL